MKSFSLKLFFIGGFVGFGLLFGFLLNRPDGLLHIVFCDVGQGDAIYIQFPNGKDMLIDGGPGTRVLECLSKYMPFYDRAIDLVVLTHPEKDHFFGLTSVIKRYKISYFLTVPVINSTEECQLFLNTLTQTDVLTKSPTTGEQITIGAVRLGVLWPHSGWMQLNSEKKQAREKTEGSYLQNIMSEAKSNVSLNSFSIYLHLNYLEFDALFTGDGDSTVQQLMSLYNIRLPEEVEILKFPHHGSKTGMDPDALATLKPDLTVIQVGKNSYGHPDPITIQGLSLYGKIATTKDNGNIEVISDGTKWWIAGR